MEIALTEWTPRGFRWRSKQINWVQSASSSKSPFEIGLKNFMPFFLRFGVSAVGWLKALTFRPAGQIQLWKNEPSLNNFPHEIRERRYCLNLLYLSTVHRKRSLSSLWCREQMSMAILRLMSGIHCCACRLKYMYKSLSCNKSHPAQYGVHGRRRSRIRIRICIQNPTFGIHLIYAAVTRADPCSLFGHRSHMRANRWHGWLTNRCLPKWTEWHAVDWSGKIQMFALGKASQIKNGLCLTNMSKVK